MNANDIPLMQFLSGAKQFVVPIFQRDYSWHSRHCQQLWDDVIRIGGDQNSKGHFLGSVVYIAAEDTTAGTPRWLVIDGQQRLTTLTLLLTALRDRLVSEVSVSEGLPSAEELSETYLINRHGKGDRRYRLQLRRADHGTLSAVIDGKAVPESASERIQENFEFFCERVADADLGVLYAGVIKLLVVQVSLTRGQDDPQMIFESLNSTGEDLTQADLIRNFVLMRQDEASQTSLYQEHWQPMEALFGARYRTEFDKFMRDYLALRLRPSHQFRSDQIYHQFRNYFHSVAKGVPVGKILEEVRLFAGYYARFSLGREADEKLKDPVRRLRQLVEVASPLIMRLYECLDEGGPFGVQDLREAVELLESYVFRRAACDMQTRSLWQIFASLAYRVRKEDPLGSLKVALYRQGRSRKFPTDVEFREALESRPVYDMRNCSYLLDRLENDSKEKTDTSKLTIEHVMPQNENLNADWQAMLGNDWQSIQQKWLHRLGNITLTGYNSEYSDRAFEEKKAMPDGFNDSSVRLNKYVREQSQWTETEMQKRGEQLAARAVKIWPALKVDREAVRIAELEDRKGAAARYSVDSLGLDVAARHLFDALRPGILALGQDVVELFGPRTVVYRVFDFFLEVLPRKERLFLMANIDFSECDDPSGEAEDSSDSSFIVYATESGGTLFSIWAEEDIAAAMHIVKQAYERMSD